MQEKKPFWRTLPALITAVATLLTAGTGLYVVLREEPEGSSIFETEMTDVDDCEARVAQEWSMLRAHRGDVTEAMDDVTDFLLIVTESGCIGSTYDLDIGKQGIKSAVATILEEYSSSVTDEGRRYHYRKVEMTLDVFGERSHALHTLRKPIGIDGDWEMVE